MRAAISALVQRVPPNEQRDLPECNACRRAAKSALVQRVPPSEQENGESSEICPSAACAAEQTVNC